MRQMIDPSTIKVDTSNLAKLNAENKFQGVGADSDSYIIINPGGVGKSGGSIVISQDSVSSPLTLQKGSEAEIDFYPISHSISMYKKVYFGSDFNNKFFFPMFAGNVNHNLLTDKTVKTLFGNQSIYTADGTGNIDLYAHDITITKGTGKAFLTVYSSKNTNIDSLDDLKTIAGNTFTKSCTGYINGKVIVAITEASFLLADGTTEALTGATFVDNPTTI